MLAFLQWVPFIWMGFGGTWDAFNGCKRNERGRLEFARFFLVSSSFALEGISWAVTLEGDALMGWQRA